MMQEREGRLLELRSGIDGKALMQRSMSGGKAWGLKGCLF